MANRLQEPKQVLTSRRTVETTRARFLARGCCLTALVRCMFGWVILAVLRTSTPTQLCPSSQDQSRPGPALPPWTRTPATKMRALKSCKTLSGRYRRQQPGQTPNAVSSASATWLSNVKRDPANTTISTIYAWLPGWEPEQLDRYARAASLKCDTK